MKVVWLAVNASHAHASLALPLLQTACAQVPSIDWQAVQTTGHDDPAVVAAAVCAHRPDLVAATLYLFNRRPVLDALARVRALLPTCAVIVGGPECLGENAGLLARHPWVDIAVRGEGEAVMPELLRRLAHGETVAGLPGVCSRDAGGLIHDAGTRAVFADWASAPPPCGSPFFAADRPFVQIETSRGCRGRCTYCTSCGARPLRRRPIAAVKAELSALRERGVREVRVLDRTFNEPPARAAELLELFLHAFAGMRFHLEVDPAGLPERLRALLREAPPGALHIEAGLQTTAPTALAAVGRASRPANALDGVRFLVRETAIPTHVDLLAGLPGQTLADVEKDIEELLELGPDEIQLEVLKILPGTPLRATAAQLELCYAPVPPYEVLGTAACTAADLRRVAGWSRVLDGFYNPPTLRPAFRAQVAAPGRFAEFAERCAAHGLTRAPAGLERRFAYLARTAAAGPPSGLDLVRLGWMAAGLSPAAPLPGATPWKAAVPPDVTWNGDAGGALAARVPRIWHLPLSDRDCWFVYDRGCSRGRPVACASRPRQATGH